MEQGNIVRENIFNILVIDDNPDHVELIKEFSDDMETEYGTLKIRSFTDEEKGIEYFKKNSDKIDTILLDYTLPRINGIKVLRILREIDQNTIIIGLTGHSDNALLDNGETIAEQFTKAGANGYISKSVENYQRLDEIIKKYKKK
ncbi:MAG: response regulator [Promethearchaeota archaeon]